MKLHEIPLELAALEQKLIDSEGELTPELEAEFDAVLKGGRDKVEACAMIIRKLYSNAEQCEARANVILEQEVTPLVSRAESHTKNAVRLSNLVLSVIDSSFSGKVKTPLLTVWGQTSPDTYNVDLVDGMTIKAFAEIRPGFVRTNEPELNKKAIIDAYKSGMAPDELLITPQPGKRSLRIK